MHRRILILGLLFSGCSSLSPPTFGRMTEPLSSSKLTDEISQGLLVLERSFENLQGRCSFQTEVDYDDLKKQQRQRGEDSSRIKEQGRRLLEQRQITFAVSGEHHLCDVNLPNDEARIDARPERPKGPRRQVFCKGPRGDFALEWSDLDDFPQIKSSSNENNAVEGRYGVYTGAALRCPFSIYAKRLVDLFQDPDFKIQRIESMTIDGNECPHVFFDWAIPARTTQGKPASSVTRCLGSFVVDPTLSYALREFNYHVVDKPGMNLAVRIEYQPPNAAKDLPLPKRVEINFAANRRTAVYEELTRTIVPKSRFSLSAYGLPEMDRPVGDINRNVLAYWLGGWAVAMLCLAGWLWRRSRAKVA